MVNEPSSKPSSSENFKWPSWVVVVVVLAFLGFSWWKNSNSVKSPETSVARNSEAKTATDSKHHQSPENLPDENEPALAETTHAHDDTSRSVAPLPPAPGTHHVVDGPLATHRENSRGSGPSKEAMHSTDTSHQPHDDSAESIYKIENQTIRDLNGNVAYKGTIDLKPTLDRIERGEANRHRNDGTSFQNREGRLPRKPNGYYKEYVHPTPNESGPGPQRIIIGRDGDTWYTPDHYKTFKKIK